ncbi:ParB/RepB/Spo0J family partition protein [Burkholderia ubonensis]|uniref:ParB/RepB/Spo0J family partition protein n=1 Tax=Burkholderia ubonensis TaxID=101571 RepID=UPI00075D9517|nr:ParB/RepB/Spo0J family partition protein [Burkholderia ubonensis]KVL70337.1 chromosome partitioning protein ParB [Burkholderia ubonensis]KVL73200.1 chromosome partitioning protein ParB [Burkholderia ubonensis]KVL91028.1 chromosome partitioning protein ParB [Burkholderia ubonensis]
MSAFGNKISKLSQIQKQGAAAALPGERIEEIDPDLVDCEKQIRSKDNPGFTVVSLTELGNDMKRDGQHEPAVLRKNPKKPGRYLMVAGERRWRGCKIAGIKLKAVVRDMDDDQARRVQRAENIQRENLTQLEIAVALREDKQRLGTLEKVAAEWNKGINWVSERIKFLEVVEADGHASEAVASGVTADITAVNDLHRLEKADPVAARAVIDQAKADPSTNVRKAVRDKLKDAKPANKGTAGKGVSRMRETQPSKAKQAEPASDMAAVVADATAQAQVLCDQVGVLSKLLQERRDVFGSLADAMQSVVNAQVELSRTRHALTALTKPE